jgi:mono/diheme cytochrome c family protein
LLALLLGCAGALGGCLQADTLGDSAPDEVRISGPPTWTNGVAALMSLKCAVCHQQPRPEVAPNTIPADLDLRQQSLVGTTRGAENLILFVRAGILRQDVYAFPRMPLPHATPLTSGEQAALLAWANATPPPDVAGDTSVAAGLTLYATYCQGCHGVHGSHGKYTSIAGSDPVIIQLVIQQALTAVPQMAAWPSLPGLTVPEQQAIANYLASP